MMVDQAIMGKMSMMFRDLDIWIAKNNSDYNTIVDIKLMLTRMLAKAIVAEMEAGGDGLPLQMEEVAVNLCRLMTKEEQASHFLQ